MTDRTTGEDMTRSVGVIGLGAMGLPTARHLAAAGIATQVYDISPDALEAARAAGALPAAGVPELAAAAEVVFVFVPTDDDVRSVCSVEDGVLATARPGSTIVLNSSLASATCQEIAALAAERGVDVVDAPLVGGVRGAEAGTITLMVGGDEEVVERIGWALAPWTGAVHVLGPVGAGQVGKTVNNLCHWGQISAIVEALSLGQRLGVAPSALRAALMDSPVDSRTLREMHLMRFTWFEKDLKIALAAADAAGKEMPVASLALEQMRLNTRPRVEALLEDRPFG
jgi:3-hydroxyisobutyrate dehydrogenase-like beta-hydroxyacid dehydrogenase